MTAGRVAIEVDQVRFRYPNASVDSVSAMSLSIRCGELLCMLGPNGSGKTTLLRMMAGIVAPTSGQVSLEGAPASAWSPRDRGRRVAVVMQREEPAFPLRVEQTVMLGRYPHIGVIGVPRVRDHETVERCMRECDVESLRTRWVDSLSGGEWQRVRIARALAQEPKVLMLDEATANLDVRHEMEAFELASELVRERDLAGVMVTHDVNLAARFADRVVVMQSGVAAAVGSPTQVLTEELFETVFEWPVERTTRLGVPQFVPVSHKEKGMVT